ncbi:MAG: hypothetical protein COA68_13735 [Oceanobacter sp.]|jgi:hypothetical protein|nr:MAG: hypothetical protein COA68_13735 [Oceanobacter sp.]
MFRTKKALLALAIAGSTSWAQASDIQVNGFINATLGVSSNDEVSVDGYDEGMSSANNSVVGLQFFKQVNDSTSATVQLVARGQSGFNTEAAWAYVTYSFDENTDVRVGRLRTPLYHYSDFLEVGYAYNWVTPSSIIYTQSDLSSFNGADITRRFTLNSVDGFAQAYTGRYVDVLTAGEDNYAADMSNSGLVVGVNSGDFSGRIGFHKATLTLDIDPAGTRAFDQYVAGAMAAESFNLIPGLNASDFEINDSNIGYYQTSFVYDNGTTSFIAEYTYLDSESAAINNNSAYMIGGAQRFGATTVHLTYAAKEDDIDDGANGILQANAEMIENSIILGARYDYDAGSAFKLEAERHEEELNAGQEGSVGIIYRAGFSLVF